MTTRKCDRCGKFYERYGPTFNYPDKPNGIVYAALYDDHTYRGLKKFDLCPECTDKLKKWISEEYSDE